MTATTLHLNGEEGEPLTVQFRSWPFGLIALSLIAAALYVPLLANASYKPEGGGEALMAQAFEMLFLAAGLWIVLAIMLFNGGLMGSMPRWAAWLAVVLVPMAGVADTVAVDMCSRHMEWAIVLVATPAGADRLLRLVGAPALVAGRAARRAHECDGVGCGVPDFGGDIRDGGLLGCGASTFAALSALALRGRLGCRARRRAPVAASAGPTMPLPSARAGVCAEAREAGVTRRWPYI